MSKKEAFKNFVSIHPELINYVNNNEMTWQKFFEIYDLYGEENSAWNKYLKVREVNDKSSLNDLTKIVKNINMDNVQKYVGNAQKAINIIQEFTTKDGIGLASLAKGPTSARPINKFFED